MVLSRIHRLLRLIGHLHSARGHNTSTLAELCDVSRRTIFRDLETLRTAGVPLHFDEQAQHYRIVGSYYLPPTNFTADEALSLIVLCHEMGATLPFYTPARSAAMKLESSLPSRLREHLTELSDAIQIRPGPTSELPGVEPIYHELVAARQRRRCVRIHYNSLTEWREISTRLSPYKLLFSRRAWYVIGRSSLHRSTRTFNVGRITRVETLQDRFRVPRGFSLSRYLRNAWHLIPEPGPDQDVAVRFAQMVAQNVAEVGWHKTQRLVPNDDGTLDFHVTVSGLNEISWWILGYGDQALVLKPARLREIVVTRARRLLERYRQLDAQEEIRARDTSVPLRTAR